MDDITLRTLQECDWQIYKELRLASLKNSPDSFGSTHKRESTFTEKDWRSRLNGCNDYTINYPVIAECNQIAIGLIWGVINKEKTACQICQMWVAPTARGLGVGKLLLGEIVSWAKTQKIERVQLSVTTANQPAIKLYQSQGFVPFGSLKKLRPDSHLLMQKMELEVTDNYL